LVKLAVDEDYSARVRSYVFAPSQSWRVCTSYCFVESLGALKLKHRRGELSERAYIAGNRRLMRLVKDDTLRILPGDFPHLSAFAEAERMVKTYGIDFLDAFQLISVRESWGYLAPPSQPILVTADGDLANAAKHETLLVWYCRETHRPTC
jgi:predicted nucleic acid-binding protein